MAESYHEVKGKVWNGSYYEVIAFLISDEQYAAVSEGTLTGLSVSDIHDV